eukprot:7342914-Prymnesium_polylepis.1
MLAHGEFDVLAAALYVDADGILLRSWLDNDGANGLTWINRHDLIHPDIAFWAPDGNTPPTPP